jgi:hypothetical protein
MIVMSRGHTGHMQQYVQIAQVSFYGKSQPESG